MNKAKGFNEFMDRHRDPKDIEKEVLIVSIFIFGTLMINMFRSFYDFEILC